MNALETVLSKLKDVRRVRKCQWTACCPAHPDQNPSLSIGLGRNDKVLLNCFAGCSFSEICEAANLDPRELAGSSNGDAGSRSAELRKNAYASAEQAVEALPAIVGRTKGSTWNVVAEYPYRTALGVEIARVIRLEPANAVQERAKTFRPISLDPAHNVWILRDPPGPWPLYRLTELRGPGRVWVCEGEKCVEAMRGLGLVATTSAHGAKAPHRTDWSPLAGRDVVILPDYDTAGIRYAERVSGILMRLSPPCRIRIVQLPGLPAGGDIVEFLAERRDSTPVRQEIEDLADRTPIRQPPVDDLPVQSRAVIVQLSEITPQPLQWLWLNRIPFGKLTMFAGDPGVGKSLIIIDLAARVSTGAALPDCQGSGEAQDVLLLTAEDDLHDTVRPRLDVAGADPDRIVCLKGVREMLRDGYRSFLLARDLALMEEALRNRPTIRLVIIDPISAYLGGADSHRNDDVRGLLAPLSEMAARNRVAVVAVTHLNKGHIGRALYRMMGSLAFVAAARAAHLFVADPNDPARRFMLSIKTNLGSPPAGLAYRIERASAEGVGQVGRIVWYPEPVLRTADEVLTATVNGEGRYSALEEAEAWLADALGSGPIAAKDVKSRAAEAGIKSRTLERARAKLGVLPKRAGFGHGSQWVWSMPAKVASSCEGHQSSPLAFFGKLGNLRVEGASTAQNGSEGTVGGVG